MEALLTLSPLDGRYREKIEALAEIFSELGLMRHRLTVEGEYLIALSEHPQIGLRRLSEQEQLLLKSWSSLLPAYGTIIKTIENKGWSGIKKTNHDVKAVEYFMRLKFMETSLSDCLEWIHFGLTSADVDNLAYGLMLSSALTRVIIPELEKIVRILAQFANDYSEIPMLARTHGQPASPTTVGKEFRVFAERIARQLKQLIDFRVSVKINGAVGNYNAHVAAYPDVDWIAFTKDFVARLNGVKKTGLAVNLITTQIEPHDTYAELFCLLKRINVILLDLVKDIWRYISDDWIAQLPVQGEVGSSTMPHKINPIDFENAEGNLGIANALFDFFANKLPESRLQRDLSDSTVIRNFGVALGHSLVAYKSVIAGLQKIDINKAQIELDLGAHPEIVGEGIQTVLRRESMGNAYEKLKSFTRGKKVTEEDFGRFIEDLDIPEKVKDELKRLSPQNYTGLASVLAKYPNHYGAA